MRIANVKLNSQFLHSVCQTYNMAINGQYLFDINILFLSFAALCGAILRSVRTVFRILRRTGQSGSFLQLDQHIKLQTKRRKLESIPFHQLKTTKYMGLVKSIPGDRDPAASGRNSTIWDAQLDRSRRLRLAASSEHRRRFPAARDRWT